jgi:outer membrane protein assembly factor BamD
MYFLRTLALMLALALPLALTACSGSDLTATPAPEELYRLARVELEGENFIEARELLAQLRDEYPFSPYAVEAELMEADSFYAEKSYDLALENYASFQSLHPFHEKVAYSLYKRGLSYLALIDTIDRDQSAPRNAIAVFTQLIEGFPGNPYIAQATEERDKCLDLMAQRELYVAKFYKRTDRPEAALSRLRTLIKNYPASSVSEEALKMAFKLEANIAKEEAAEQ